MQPHEAFPALGSPCAAASVAAAPESWSPVPRRSRKGPGLAGALAEIKQSISDGKGVPSPTALARALGWKRADSARDALTRLAAEGYLRRVGREVAGGQRRTIYELTLLGTAPREKRCSRCHAHRPAEAFWPSQYSADGLAAVCRECIRAAAEFGRAERERNRVARQTASFRGSHG